VFTARYGLSPYIKQIRFVVQSVYSAVRTESLYKTDNFRNSKGYKFLPVFSTCDITFGRHWHNKFERDSDVNL
jgi:hypothetical protein